MVYYCQCGEPARPIPGINKRDNECLACYVDRLTLRRDDDVFDRIARDANAALPDDDDTEQPERFDEFTGGYPQ